MNGWEYNTNVAGQLPSNAGLVTQEGRYCAAVALMQNATPG